MRQQGDVSTAQHPWVGRRISEVLDQAVDTWPDQLALVDDERRFTYTELREGSWQVDANLRSLGIREEEHVALLMPNSWQQVLLHYALHRIGAVIVPINLSWESAEVSHALRASNAAHLIVGRLPDDEGSRLKVAGILQSRSALPRVRQVICDQPADGVDVPLDQLFVDSGADLTEAERPTGDIAYILFTSGSSAAPKAALIGHQALLGTAHYNGERLAISPGDHYLNMLPLFHCGGLSLGLLATHQRGGTLHVFNRFDVVAMVESVRRWQPAITAGFDVMVRQLLEAVRQHLDTMPLKRIASSPGISLFDFAQSVGVDTTIIYAMTEGACTVAITNEEDDAASRRNSNGFPLPGVEVRVCDPELGTDVPAGTPGELRFRGWNLTSGYYMGPDHPPQLPLDESGYFRTGDYGFVDADGRVYYRGRYAGMVKSGGENVSQVEVEGFLTGQVSGIRQAAVVGVPDDDWGEIVVAFVGSDTEQWSTESLRQACRGRLARYKIPRLVIQLEDGEWPLSGPGKIDKRALVTRAQATRRSMIS